jgi:hypothetical protein
LNGLILRLLRHFAAKSLPLDFLFIPVFEGRKDVVGTVFDGGQPVAAVSLEAADHTAGGHHFRKIVVRVAG